jgi:hypothetical protein
MCSSSSPPTKFSGGPIQIVGTVGPPDPKSPQPLTPFAATAYPSPDFTKDTKLQAALESARTEMATQLGPHPVAFSFLLRNANGSTRYAGVDDDLMHYSASMLKVAAMYAAHELLNAAKRLATSPPTGGTSPPFFDRLETTFDQMIKDAAAPLQAAGKVKPTDGSNVLEAAERVAANVTNPITGVKDYRSTPSYPSIFNVTTGAGTPTVTFLPVFTQKMREMIVASDDPAAAECIRRLSYTYINAALMKGGFYNPASAPPNGIWLAGDYTGFDANPSSVARITSQNDGLAAQVTTTKQMLRMIYLIESNHPQMLVETTNPMRGLLGSAAALGGFLRKALLGTDPPFLLELSKIGVGPLKTPTGMSTYSEVQFMKWTASTPNLVAKGLKDEFFVCWQNLQQPGTSLVKSIVEVITRTLTKLTNSL